MKNKNSVELIDYMGSDRLHGLAAWSSTFLEFGVDMPDDPHLRVDELVNHILNNGKKKRSLEDLIGYLAEHSHNSPFRFSSFVFGMTTDISTHIQKLKHKVLLEAENGESARYKELTADNFYLPEDWNVPAVNFSTEDVSYTQEKTWNEILSKYTEVGNQLYHEAIKQLTPVLGKKRTKETARFFKTYNSQINTLNKFSFDGIIQFHHKRGDSTVAQTEIAFVANEMVRLVKNIPNNPFEYSLKAFGL